MNTATTTTWRRRAVASLGAVATVLATMTLVSAPAQAGQGVVVSPVPSATAPRVTDGRVYDIAVHGSTVVVGGSFTKIRPGAGGADQARQWLFMYNSTTGEISRTFLPELGGPAPAADAGLVKDQPGVEAIEFAADGQSIYVGGWFTTVNGAPAQRIVQLNLDGSVRASFQASANNTVMDLALTGGRLIAAGRFGTVNGQPANRLIALDPTTGAVQTDFNLPATESRNQYAPFVNEIDASDDGRWLVVAGSFRKIAGVTREQVALINLQGKPALANWATDSYVPNCSSASTDSGNYIRGLAFSPDSSYFVVSTTGAFIGAETMCDSAARWEVAPDAGENAQWTWRAKTGGDTLWATEVTDSAVYVGGHQRWMNNPRPSPGGDNDGPGSVQRPGIAALDPVTGVPLSWNPGRDRGRGAEAIVATDDFLFVGHDTDLWGGGIRQRLAQLPVAGGTANPQPVKVDLPVDLWFTTGSTLGRAAFDGATVGSASTASGPAVDGIDWSGNRGGFVQDGRAFYFGDAQAFWSRPFDGTTFGAPTNLSTSVGYVDTNYNLTPYDQPYGVAETTAATYSNGRIYYVKSGDTKLYQRGFSLESGIIEGSEYVASSQSFSSARALSFIGDWLYAAWSDGRLYRFHAPQGRVDYQSRTLVDDGRSIRWQDVRGFWATPGTGTAVPPTAPSLTCTAATPWTASYWANTTFTGAPSTTRCETAIDYSYGNGAPTGTDVPADGFAVTWTRTVDLTEPGAIKIDATVDDGVRAYVDGKRVINSWIDSSATLRTGTSGALAAGPHQVRIEYYERSGGATAKVSTSVVAAPAAQPEPDNAPGDTDISTPSAGQVLAGPAVTTTGTATDNVGVTQVRVGIYNNAPGASARWLQADGTWGTAYAFRNATLAAPGAPSTTWSLGPVTLPEGDYAIDARTADAAGYVDPDRAWRTFSVRSTVVDTTKPVAAVSNPTQGQVVGTSTVPARGTATDDTGVTEVRVGVADRTNPSAVRWLQADGTWGSTYAFRLATLDAPGAPSTGWSISTTVPDGPYALDVRALDARRNLSAAVWRPFTVTTVAPDTTAPTTLVTAPAKSSTVTTRTVPVQGTTTDDVATTQVRVAVYDRANSAAPWLQADGTWGTKYAFRSATISGTGASATWDLGVSLPDGLYAFDVRGADRAGNLSSAQWWPFAVNVPSADRVAPTTSLVARGVTVRRGTVALSGSARDNRNMRTVLVAVKRAGAPAQRQWLQTNGSWGEVQVFRKARLSRPGGRTTTWKLDLRLPRGRFDVSVLSTDRSVNVQRRALVRRVVVRQGG